MTWVTGLNLLGSSIELTVASIIGSAVLSVDAADSLENFLTNLLALITLGWSLVSRRKTSFGLAGLTLIPAIVMFGAAIWKMISGEPSGPLILSTTTIIVMVINLVYAVPLIDLHKADSTLMRGVWLAARNDVLASLFILTVGVIAVFWLSAWPDIVAGLVIGVINLTAAEEIYKQARAEGPELEMDNGD